MKLGGRKENQKRRKYPAKYKEKRFGRMQEYELNRRLGKRGNNCGKGIRRG